MLKSIFPRLANIAARLRISPQMAILLSILLLSVVLRIGGALFLGDTVRLLPGTADQLSYHTLAVRVLEGHGFTFGQDWWPITAAGTPTAHWSFLYTYYLVGVYTIFGVHPLIARLIQAVVVGILHPYLTYLLAQHLFAPTEKETDDRIVRVVPLVAAAITAGYAYFIYYAASLMTEPFYITAILGLLYLAIRLAEPLTAAPGARVDPKWGRLAIGIGVTLAICVLLRQLLMLFFPFLALWLLWRGRHHHRLGKTVLALAIASIILILAILPFTVYNYARFDQLVLLNTNSGYAFFFGNHPVYGTNFVGILPPEMGSYGDLIPEGLRHLDEAALDQALLKEALAMVASDPVRYVLLSISRTREYFKFWPSPASSTMSNFFRVASFGVMLPFMLYGLGRALQRYRSKPALWLLLLFMVFYTGVHLLSWTLIRYRLPVDAILILFAGYGIVDLATRLARTWGIDNLVQHGQIRDVAG